MSASRPSPFNRGVSPAWRAELRDRSPACIRAAVRPVVAGLVAKLLAQGVAPAEIARRLGTGRASVYRIIGGGVG